MILKMLISISRESLPLRQKQEAFPESPNLEAWRRRKQRGSSYWPALDERRTIRICSALTTNSWIAIDPSEPENSMIQACYGRQFARYFILSRRLKSTGAGTSDSQNPPV